MKVTKVALVVMKGKKALKNLYQLIGEIVKGGMSSGVKGKEKHLGGTTQRQDNNGFKKVRFVENVTDMTVKPSSSMVEETSSSEMFKHCLNSIASMSC